MSAAELLAMKVMTMPPVACCYGHCYDQLTIARYRAVASVKEARGHQFSAGAQASRAPKARVSRRRRRRGGWSVRRRCPHGQNNRYGLINVLFVGQHKSKLLWKSKKSWQLVDSRQRYCNNNQAFLTHPVHVCFGNMWLDFMLTLVSFR